MTRTIRFLTAVLALALVAGCADDDDPLIIDTDQDHVFTYVPSSGTPTINSINVAGSFNDWDAAAQAMTEQTDGSWTATVTLSPGTYQYKYVFNGDQWASNMCDDATWGNPGFSNKVDPDVTECVDDGFGGQNAVLVIE